MLDPPDLILMVCDPNLTLLFHSDHVYCQHKLTNKKQGKALSTNSCDVYHSFNVVVLGMFTSLYVVIVIIRLVGEALEARVVPKWCRFHSVATSVTRTVSLTAGMCQTVSNLSVY